MTGPLVVDGFEVIAGRGDAHGFHHRDLAGARAPAIWIHRVERPAIVVGSTQPVDVVDRVAAERAGFEVTGRRSGGGLVVVDPDESCWIDVIVPRGHPRWDDDVTRAFHWVGERWRTALETLGVPNLVVHRGPSRRADVGRIVCFSGVGAGEVLRSDGGGDPRKVVGLSQRRTREVARIQGLYVRRWDPEPLRRFVVDGVIPTELVLDEIPAGLLGPYEAGDAPRPAPVVDAFLSTFRAAPPD